mgnify:FL=1|tara:strand:+ start:314 stop:523 length:210 start_codon:yes stop_codon:yes gene_type:complete
MQQLKEDLRIVLGAEIPQELDDILDKVVRLYHKRTNGPIGFDTVCLLATLWYSGFLKSPKKPVLSGSSK